jgi:hypothetical protein
MQVKYNKVNGRVIAVGSSLTRVRGQVFNLDIRRGMV